MLLCYHSLIHRTSVERWNSAEEAWILDELLLDSYWVVLVILN